ncbi:P-loop containing nucleoside triphosphate hydrolase protein, partial [Cantharellus anzutake]|uniref:P-loop containing nucleoside triphosphate hydrolase protein n=1 Tax=Cantharellus anzutake TaxID=1750568 RepID=UPI0019081B24
PAEWFPRARSLKRTIHLHVGPTNSGKTYNALRALAGALTGVYAGPLRLLAHEVWERLNNGSITAPPKDAGRPCNLLTGEEHRIVDPAARLLSCTVEMLPRNAAFDVAVIDEIQMIADPFRGSAWTYAVLGVCAKEVHLCGEDTAVDLIQRLAVDAGDDVVIHRYQRLTPLVVSPSLHGDFSKVQKGDCVVAFSRNKIFQTKRKIEKETGLKCAVAYGRLPPEVRSEQAQHFNHLESVLDVMVASDAIGMGLNLKIRRVIFASLQKWDGKDVTYLTLSQTKQIAGRAGRFGLHTDGSIGEVTTMWSSDLARLKFAMKSTNPSITQAYIELPEDKLEALYNALPSGGGFRGINVALEHLALPSPNYTPLLRGRDDHAAAFVDKKMGNGFFAESCTFLKAPVQWRDPQSLESMNDYVDAYNANIQVDLEPILDRRGYLAALRTAQGLNAEPLNNTSLEPPCSPGTPPYDNTQLSDSPDPSVGQSTRKQESDQAEVLQTLEVMHKSLVLYLWLSQRLPLAFSNRDKAQKFKDDVEGAIDGLL